MVLVATASGRSVMQRLVGTGFVLGSAGETQQGVGFAGCCCLWKGDFGDPASPRGAVPWGWPGSRSLVAGKGCVPGEPMGQQVLGGCVAAG